MILPVILNTYPILLRLNFMTKDKGTFFLLIIIFIGGFLRFYNLNWDQGLILNPDELDVGKSVLQLEFPNQMNPHFYRYGSLVVYLAFFTRLLFGFITTDISPWILGRFYSALFSTLTILVIYLIGRFFLSRKWALLAAFLLSFTAGSIQQAHFTTPETNETFFMLLSLLFLLRFTRQKSWLSLILASISFGLALSAKVSTFVFAPVFLTAISLAYLPKPHLKQFKQTAFSVLKLIKPGLFTITVAIITFMVTSPYTIWDFSSYKSAIEFEQQVATGSFPVFYTRQFINTTPIIFQMEKIFPYALGPALLVSGLIGLTFFLVKVLKDKYLLLTAVAFFSIFLPNAFLFVKWTRYMAPVLPFFPLFSALFLSWLYHQSKAASIALAVTVSAITIFWAIAFFSIYQNPDSRLAASKWLQSQTPKESIFAVEGYNVVDLPLHGFERLSLVLYYLDDNTASQQDLADALEKSDYFIVQSRRVFANHQRLPKLFPQTSWFYDTLFSGELGFIPIKQFESYPRLPIFDKALIIPDEMAEETWSVFDHPVIRVFKKQVELSKTDYLQVLDNTP